MFKHGTHKSFKPIHNKKQRYSIQDILAALLRYRNANEAVKLKAVGPKLPAVAFICNATSPLTCHDICL
jgi:hypothetical protein